MNRIFLFVIILLCTDISAVEGKECRNTDKTFDLSGEVESLTEEAECLSIWDYCSWWFYFPTDLPHIMFRMNFTTNFIQTETNLVRMDGDCCWRDNIKFDSIDDEICWVTYNSDLCLDKIKQSGCETRDWGINVSRTIVGYKCEPSKAQFNLSYEYIDCITGKRIESLETAQPTTYQPTKTVSETAGKIKTPFSHYSITSTVTRHALSSQAIEDYQDDPMTISPQTIGLIAGGVVLVFILQITACKAYFYSKNRNRRAQEGQDQINTCTLNRPLPVPPSTLLHKEVNNQLPRTGAGATPQITIPNDTTRYTSRPKNSQASPQPAMASSSQSGYEVVNLEKPEPDYIPMKSIRFVSANI